MIGSCLSSSILALTPAFTFPKDFLYSDSFDFYAKGTEVGAVFLNPAGLQTKSLGQVRLEGRQDFLGYSTFSAGGLVSFSIGTLALGYARMGANDLIRVSPSLSSTDRPTITGTFSDLMERVALSWAYPVESEWTVGVTGTYFSHHLDTDLASYGALDVGVLWSPLPYWKGGLYTDSILTTPFQWQGSGASDFIKGRVLVENFLEFKPVSAKVLTDFNQVKWSGKVGVADQISLLADVVTEGLSHFQQTSVGILLTLDPIVLQYNYIFNLTEGLDSSQSRLGLLVRYP